jgi:sugar phosphate isomerase/epimerase
MIKRRDFIRNAALGLGAALAGTRGPLSLSANPFGLPIGLQLYTLRDQLAHKVPGTLRQVAAIGYKQVELYALYGKTPAEFARLLREMGLAAPSSHYMTAQIRTGWQKHIEDAQVLGLKYMVNAIVMPEDRKSPDDYKRLVELFNKAGEQTRRAGIQFCYHNHNFEFKKYGTTTAYDYLLQLLDPALVKMEMDCFWVTHAGQDPVAYFRKYPGRFPLLHIKDLAPGYPHTQTVDARVELFEPVGKGTIDWKRIFAAAPKGGLKHYFVEQDYCRRPPLEAIRLSYEYLKKLKV